jgi:hypothetical protein
MKGPAAKAREFEELVGIYMSVRAGGLGRGRSRQAGRQRGARAEAVSSLADAAWRLAPVLEGMGHVAPRLTRAAPHRSAACLIGSRGRWRTS